MIAMRLPTGELPGRLDRLSGRVTRMRSGSMPSSSPTTVAAKRLVPLSGTGGVDRHRDAAERVDDHARALHPCGGAVVLVQKRLEGRIAPRGLEAGGDPDARAQPLGPEPVALGRQRGVIGMGEHLVDHGVVIAAVIGAAGGNGVGEFVGPDQVAAAQLQPVHPQMRRDPVHHRLDGVISSAPGQSHARPPARPCWW